MKWLEQVEIGWKICAGAAAGAWIVGAFMWTQYVRIDGWVRAREADHEIIVGIRSDLAAMRKAADTQNENTRVHCLMGTFPRLWCIDNGFRVQTPPPRGEGG